MVGNNFRTVVGCRLSRDAAFNTIPHFTNLKLNARQRRIYSIFFSLCLSHFLSRNLVSFQLIRNRPTARLRPLRSV